MTHVVSKTLLMLALISSRCRALRSNIRRTDHGHHGGPRRCNIRRTNHWAGHGHNAFVRSISKRPTYRVETSLLATSKGPSAVRSLRPEHVDSPLRLLSFYRFARVDDPEAVRDGLFERLGEVRGLRGTVYVAPEGINCAFAVPTGSVEEVMRLFDAVEPNMGDVVDPTTPTFDRLIVRTRDYILRDGIDAPGEFDWTDAGSEIGPSEWDEQLREEGVQLLDCRNGYESEEGTFAGARPLNTTRFGETWDAVDGAVRSGDLDPSRPVHIFCTGGIRCVKVGAYLRQKHGIEDVRSLRHGIIGYERWRVEDGGAASGRESVWEGKNFLFDKRRFADTEPRDKQT